MALDANATGTAIANFIQANKPADGTPVTTGDLETLWQGIVQIIYDDFAANADVAAGSFQDSLAGAVTGTGGPVT